jgi:N-acetyl sugar amidotransferase
MKYCCRCVTPDTRPNGQFNTDGLCLPCASSAIDNRDNYERRLQELRGIIKRVLRGRGHGRWDCIVGVSGGKDSTRQALWVREKLRMNPLLVSVGYPPRQISHNGAHNLSNLTEHGFDVIFIGPAPGLSRRLVREAFLRFGNWCKATEMALFAGVPRIALEKGIPLIFWGENPALFVGDAGTLGSSMWDGNNLVNSNTLGGGDLSWFREVASTCDSLYPYEFPTRAELDKAKIQTLFLGPAWKDWADVANSRFALTHGLWFRGGNPKETGDLVGTRMVDEDWTIVNYLLKYYKLAFSRGTEHANMLIRSGEITRDEGISIAEEYDEACGDSYIESFCEYIGISSGEFWATVRRFSPSELFDLSGERPVKRFKVGYGLV